MIFNLKRYLNLLFLFFTIVMTFSCSEYLKGKPKKQDTIEVNKESLSCLKDVSTQFKNFLKSALTEKEIEKSFTCLDKTLTEFETRVEGKQEKSSFTDEELYLIFKTYLSDATISKEATQDLLQLKKALLGGSEQKITKTEIASLKKYLVVLKEEVTKLSPYLILFQFKKENKSFSKKTIDEAYILLKSSLIKLFQASQVHRSDYQFSDIEKLVTNLNILDEKQKDLLKLASLVQTLLVGKQPLQTQSEYEDYIDNLVNALKIFSYVNQKYVSFEIDSKDQLSDMFSFVDVVVNLLETSVQFKKTHIVSTETIDPILKELLKYDFVPVKISESTLLSFYRLIGSRVFQSGIQTDVDSFMGLNAIHFSQIKYELQLYKLYQSVIDQVSDEKTYDLLGSIQQKTKAFDLKNVVWLSQLEPQKQRRLLEDYSDLVSEFLSARPVIYRFNKMVIAANQQKYDLKWSDLSRAFYAKMLSRELIRGWGQQTVKMNGAFLSEKSLVQWYSEFKDFGVEIKAFDKRMLNSGSISFKQANLLTYSANGDDKMNFLETVQYINMLLSGGSQTLKELQEVFTKAGCDLAEQDVFGHAWIDEKCALPEFRRQFSNIFSNLSFLNVYVKSMSEQQFAQYYYSLMDVARFDVRFKGKKIETADLRMMAILLHSIESLYAVYDINQNFSFSAAEIRAAYPRFQKFATDYAYTKSKAQLDEFNGWLAQTVGGYSCYTEQDLIKESFIFLVYNGKTPQRKDLNTVPCLFGRSLINFEGEVNRTVIINTFKILKSVLGS